MPVSRVQLITRNWALECVSIARTLHLLAWSNLRAALVDAVADVEVPTFMKGNYVVVGGGVAGVCCAEEICRLQPEAAVIIVTLSDVLKASSRTEAPILPAVGL